MRDEETVGRDLAKEMGDACKVANQNLVTAKAWALLSLLEVALNNAIVEGTPTEAALFAERLVACTASLCESAAIQNLGLVGAVTNGMFAVRSQKQPIVARQKLDFVFNNVSNKVLYFIEVDENWSVLGKNSFVLVYGSKAASQFPLVEFSFGAPQYDIKIWPDKGPFSEDQKVHVGACFDLAIPIPATVNIEGRMLRRNENGNVVVLSEPVRSFVSCPESSPPQAASIASPFVALARRVLPGLFTTSVMAGDIAVKSNIGSPFDFSIFGPAGANPVGTLTWVTPPPATPTAGIPFSVSVLARSGDGRPMELVLVDLYFIGNNGLPAGADLTGDLSSYTVELTGSLGVATFPDQGATGPTLGKAGGYNVCARASIPGFTFADLCTAVNVKN
jgi:hypothetical protein